MNAVRLGGSGNFTGKLIGMTKKTTNGKVMATVELEIDGKKVKINVNNAKLVGDLEGYVPQELVSFWGTLSSYKNSEGRVYTNLRMLKLNTDGRATENSALVMGTLREIGDVYSRKDPNKVVGRYADFDTTNDPKYPEFVRLQLAFGTDLNATIGKVVRVRAYMDKLGIMVFDGNVKKAHSQVALPDDLLDLAGDAPAPTPATPTQSAPATTNANAAVAATTEDFGW